MLNISNNSVSSKIRTKEYTALQKVEDKKTKRVVLNLIRWTVLILFIIMVMPWTQNIRSTGNVTTLRPDQRPQDIHSIIAGRIDEWHVQEGDFVEKGDTIAVISEIKDDYFDEDLLPRTQNQLDLKKQSVDAYDRKLDAQNTQLETLISQMQLKLNQNEVKIAQTRLKVQNDSIDYQAAVMDNSIALYQLERMDSLYTLGVKSLADFEKRKLKAQQTQAKEISAKNKWTNSKSELVNLRIEQSNIRTKFENDYAKILSDLSTTETNKFDTESLVNKLENQFKNYEVRKGYHVITAPQNGFITKLLVQGIGETIKEGQAILSFMPENYDLAVEIYVDPIDLPLMHVGEHVRLQFDGWPAIVFSGWPSASYGTYGGTIYAVDQFISANGKYRVLVQPDESDHKWPDQLRVGSGSKAMILLNDVPVWYELWRKVNGFPPNFYQPEVKDSKDAPKKK